MSFHAGPRLLVSAVQGSPRVYFPVWTRVPTDTTPDFELAVTEARPMFFSSSKTVVFVAKKGRDETCDDTK